MNHLGYISLHRKIRDNSFWQTKPFSKGQAWVDILLRANHKSRSILIGNSSIKLRPGETVWSLKQMSNDWGWSINKVGRFLNSLESDSMLTQKRETKYTKLTVVNWKVYQQNGNQTEIKRKSNGNQTETNNNVKNDNNVNNNTYVEVQRTYDHFIKSFDKNENQYRLTDKRKKTLKLRIKQNGLEQVMQAIDFCANSDFHRGDNDRGWQADLDFIVRSQEQVEKLANQAQSGSNKIINLKEYA